MGTIYKRGKKLWLGYKNADGKWTYAATGLSVGEEAKAKKLLEKIKAKVDAGVRFGEVDQGPVTVKRFAERWLEEREKLGIVNWKNDRKEFLKDEKEPIG